MQAPVIVVGAGPAGCSVALGLARLGWQVEVLAGPRGIDACEGISRRVHEHLAAIGLRHALACVPEPSAREVEWNGERARQNIEQLVGRAAFDRGLRADLGDAGIGVHAGRVTRVLMHAGGGATLVTGDGATRSARFVVDARGRAAPRGPGVARRGPETVSILQRWNGPPAQPGSAVFAFRDGWAWLARCADGSRYTQFTVAADPDRLEKRAKLRSWLDARLVELSQAGAWVRGCTLQGPAQARGSTSLLHAVLWREDGLLRVGDAAMAVDPLSGNGIFQALSSASIAPAVINTWLREPQSEDMARRFYAERLEHIFLRFARTGRDFYRAESRWPHERFWQARAHWPDDVPAHEPSPRVLGIACRPVVEDGFVREREVVLTSEQPLGVWRVAGVEVAPLLRGPAPGSVLDGRELAARLSGAAQGDSAREHALRAWCAQHGLLAAAQDGNSKAAL